MKQFCCKLEAGPMKEFLAE